MQTASAKALRLDVLEENQALKGGQCGWRSQVGGSREYTTRLPHLYSGEESGCILRLMGNQEKFHVEG